MYNERAEKRGTWFFWRKDFNMSELMIFLRNLCITLAVISVPLLLMWLIERYKLNKAKKSAEEISQDLRENLLKDCTEEYEIGKQKIKYAVRNLGKGWHYIFFFLSRGFFVYGESGKNFRNI